MRKSLVISYLTLSAAAVFAVVVAMAVLWPMYQEIQIVEAEVATGRSELGEQKGRLNNLDQLIVSLNSNRGSEDLLAIMIPEGDSFNDFIRIIGRYGDVSGVTVGDINNRSSDQSVPGLPEEIGLQQASFSVSGPYNQVRQFLELVERSPRIIDVRSLEIGINPQGEGVSASLIVNLYNYGR